MNTSDPFEYQWPYLLTFLPDERVLESSAFHSGALRRRREITRASTLLRLAMVYAFCGYSLRATAAWGEAAGVSHVSDVALLKRFRASADWLCSILALKLAERV